MAVPVALGPIAQTGESWRLIVTLGETEVSFDCALVETNTDTVTSCERLTDGEPVPWTVTLDPDQASPHRMTLTVDREDDDSPGPTGLAMRLESAFGGVQFQSRINRRTMSVDGRQCVACAFDDLDPIEVP